MGYMQEITVDPQWERKVRTLVIEMRLAGRVQGIVAGMPVQTTGLGRTRGWKGYHGVVSHIEGDQIHVEFSLAGIGNQVLSPAELRPCVHPGCPCAQCQWSINHHA